MGGVLPLAQVVAAYALLLGACGARTSEHNDRSAAAETVDGVHTERWTLVSGGRTREVLMHSPADYDGTTPVPIVIALHGQFSDAQQQSDVSRIRDEVAVARFVALLPEGVGGSWNAGGDCCGAANTEGIDDVRFVRDLIDAAALRLNMDSKRVYVAGMSNGGYLAHRVACDLADRVAAIAAVAGVLPTAATCHPVRPMPVLAFHGKRDLLVPYDGSWLSGEPGAVETFRGWATRSSCTGPSVETFRRGDAHCETFASCEAGAAVELCTVDEGGHTWPGGTPLPLLGRTTSALSATTAMWEFFAAHPLRETR